MTGYKGFFYHFLDMKTGAAPGGERALDRRHRAPARRRAVLPVVLRRRRMPRKPRSAGSSTTSTAASTGAGRSRRAGDQPRLDAGRRVSSSTTGAATTRRCWSTCWRSARRRTPVGAEAWAEWTSTYDAQLAHVVTARVSELLAAVRPPVHARVDRLPRHPGRVHAQAAVSTISRTRAARPTRSAPTRSPIRWGARATARTSGESPRATARPTSRSTTRAASARYPHVRRARRRRCGIRTTTARSRRPRRRHRSRSRRRSRFRRCSRCTSATANTSIGQYGFFDAFNPSFDFDVPLRHGTAHRRLRLGRHRLPRHRPGPDPRDDRELPQRACLARNAGKPLSPPRAGARRLHRRVAHRVAMIESPAATARVTRRTFLSLAFLPLAAAAAARPRAIR